MKTLTDDQIIYLLKNVCKASFLPDTEKICESCPLSEECLYYFVGEDSEENTLKISPIMYRKE